MAMMFGDRKGGSAGYSAYTTSKPFERKPLAREELEGLRNASTRAELENLMRQLGLSSLLKDFQAEFESPTGRPKRSSHAKSINAKLESQDIRPRLFRQLRSLLVKGSTFADIQRLLYGADGDALLELSAGLDCMAAELRASHRMQTFEIGELLEAVNLLVDQILDSLTDPRG